MLVKDIMTTNVVTISSSTPVMEARKLMEVHKIRRVPVVDKGKVVGVVSKNSARRAGPSEATSLSVWEINYLMAKMTVKEILNKEIVAVTPDCTVESAIATAQEHGVGALMVVDGDMLVGVLTTNDFFYKILNPLLGINEDGKRIIVYGADTPDQVTKVMDVIKSQGVGIKAMHTIAVADAASKDLILHLDIADAGKVTEQLKGVGFHVHERDHHSC